MNYIKIYWQLVRRAKNRILTGYTEKHHIAPQCIYGANKYIVELTAKEHYICHFLLFKWAKKKYGNNHWKTIKLGYAFYKMTMSSSTQQRYYSRTYAIAKHWYSENNPSKYRNLKGPNNPMFGRTGELHHRFGLKHSNQTKEKISKANKGKLTGDKNPSKRQEVRNKISIQNSDGRTARKGKQHGKYNHHITDHDRTYLKEQWASVQHYESLYSFTKRMSSIYNCTRSGIQSIVYRSPNVIS